MVLMDQHESHGYWMEIESKPSGYVYVHEGDEVVQTFRGRYAIVKADIWIRKQQRGEGGILCSN